MGMILSLEASYLDVDCHMSLYTYAEISEIAKIVFFPTICDSFSPIILLSNAV